MTTELTYLTLTALLAASMWIPYVIGISTDPSEEEAFARPAQIANLRPWVQRAHRAHLNLLEQAMPFAVLVLIAHASGLSNTTTALAAAVFFWARVVHAIGMISGMARLPVRPIIYTVGWVCILIFAWQILTQG
jgi:uncharacterized MAPEG superfamily protein